jgi:antitoxin PrlF
MPTVRSKVTSKYQTVIPKAVRERLGLKTGDVIRFNVSEEGAVVLEKDAGSEDDPFACFEEWKSDEDEHLYRDL